MIGWVVTLVLTTQFKIAPPHAHAALMEQVHGAVESNDVARAAVEALPWLDTHWPNLHGAGGPLDLTHYTVPFAELLSASIGSVALGMALTNLAVFLAWGVVHSLLAQRQPQALLAMVVPVQAVRVVYVTLAVVTLHVAVGLWLPMPSLLWSVPLLPFWATVVLSVVCMGLPRRLLPSEGMFDQLEFMGITPLFMTRREMETQFENRSTPSLVTTGVYGVVRHPLYFELLFVLLVTPVMTLDRFVFTLCVVGYLVSFGLPLEERKLIQSFGSAYEKYCERVPSMVPNVHGWKVLLRLAPVSHTD